MDACLRIRKWQFWIKKNKKFLLIFLKIFVIKTLDPGPYPDPDSLEMLDPGSVSGSELN
jgi:hypothetical protein